MRVCLFADAQSVHIQQLAPGLAARGVDVHIVTHKPAEVSGCTVERFRIPKPGLTNLRRWRARQDAYLASFLRDFDVVNIHFLNDWGFIGGNASDDGLAGDSCLVVTAWGSDIVDPPGETPASQELIRARIATLQRAAAVTTCGPTFARTVEQYAGLEQGSVQVAGFGVNLKLFTRGVAGESFSNETPRVGFFKGFRPVYGADRLVRAMPLVLEQVRNARFEMVGDGADLLRCKELAESLGVSSSITWHDRQPLSALPKLLETWNVSVVPSVHEAFGVAALESSAMGVPVVASDVCGLRDTVRNDETGLLVDSATPAKLAGAIVEILRDDSRRNQMAAAGRVMVEREYRWCDLIQRWIELYETARELRCAMV